ncbi:MAG: tRNA uridine-5-carboxymethylaminomethyl(34) synthesis GTPase MnmE [Rhodobacteraceae bacterium]|nr:tRNA uridine-5-carboxymethylaminomethyl(34) synthesis GTPase MnmE [Paracoccaceae bacterium]
MDTIYALASARGKSGVAIVRVSGPAAPDVSQSLTGKELVYRRATLCRLSAQDGSHIDDALVINFPAGESFTGEPTVEFQTHGALATVDALLARLKAEPGLRLADPGEFTRRALENERLDLAQVEGLGDLIEAETEAQRKQALRVLSGALGAKAEEWRTCLIRAAALVAATIDFADEEVPVDVSPEVLKQIDRVIAELVTEAAGARAAERIREGFEVAIVGAPNVGKSTLLNALAGREAAITSEVAGTTRDIVEVRMDLGGLPVTLLDTAGLRETDDLVESIGVDRAKARGEAADLRVFLVDDDAATFALKGQPGDIVLRAKGDIRASEGPSISGKTGQGVSELVAELEKRLSKRASGAGLMIRERHRTAVLGAIEGLESARNHVLAGAEYAELAAEDLALSVRALDSLVGRVDVENILDEIFASFCLGK